MIIRHELQQPIKAFINKIFNTIELSNDKGFIRVVDLNDTNKQKYKELL